MDLLGMIENSEIWKLISDTICTPELQLFDIELPYRGPRSGGGVLRVFLTRTAKAENFTGNNLAENNVTAENSAEKTAELVATSEAPATKSKLNKNAIETESIEEAASQSRVRGVGLEDCARACKKLRDLPELETLIPGDWSLEVSSPGINRKLRLTKHFEGAVGERIRAIVRDEQNNGKVVVGQLRSFNGQQIEIFDEERRAPLLADVAMVTDARIDFKFE